MATGRTVWDRIRAWFHFEGSASLLEAYRRARPSVMEVMDLAQARRLECAIQDLHPWKVPPATRAELLCAWNAFALQTLGDAILEADYASGPATLGFVPPLSARQAQAFYAQVEEWLTRARQARADPGFQLDVSAPVRLPGWIDSDLDGLPASLLQGLLRAMRSLEEHLDAAMALLPEAGEPAWRAQLERLRGRHASARAMARRALDRDRAGPFRNANPERLSRTREAIEHFYELGQLIAGRPDAAAPVPPPPPPAAAPPR